MHTVNYFKLPFTRSKDDDDHNDRYENGVRLINLSVAALIYIKLIFNFTREFTKFCGNCMK